MAPSIRRVFRKMVGKGKQEDSMAERTRSNSVIHRPDWATTSKKNTAEASRPDKTTEMSFSDDTTAASPPDPTTKDLPSDQDNTGRLTLLTLPADIRNMIYHLVCYHHENRGIIAPILSSYRDPFTRHHLTTHAVINGSVQFAVINPDDINTMQGKDHNDERYKFDYAHTYYYQEDDKKVFRILKRHLAAGGSGRDHLYMPREYNVYFGHGKATYKYAHICDEDCLNPPELVSVNRQLWQEARSYFYGANKFVFHFGDNIGIERMCVKWWRTLSTEDLRLLEHLRLERHVHGTNYEGSGRHADHITIRRIADSTNPNVTLRGRQTDRLCPLLRGTDHKVTKRNVWRSVRLHCIVELYRQKIEANGLTAEYLEMLLLARRWFTRDMATFCGHETKLKNMLHLFMWNVKAGKAKKLKMVVDGTVALKLRRSNRGRPRVGTTENGGVRFGVRESGAEGEAEGSDEEDRKGMNEGKGKGKVEDDDDSDDDDDDEDEDED